MRLRPASSRKGARKGRASCPAGYPGVIPTWNVMGLLQALRNSLKNSATARAFSGFGSPRPQPCVEFDSSGIRVALDPADLSTVTHTLLWSDVTRARAFKRDLFAVDLVCLSLEAAEELALEVNEEMGGWSELLEALPTLLPGCMNQGQILDAVLKPPFATNETEVFRRVSQGAV